jgi:ferrochelatase
MSQAVLLVNLGSPDSTDVADVKRYLHEFLTDERVIDVPFVRKVIVPLIILNTRPKKSAEAYASIWTDQGSPLIATSVHQQTALQDKVAPKVYLAMRYGNPAIEDTIRQIRADGVDSLLVIPLYPQYAMSSYETVVVKVMEAIQAHHPDVEVDVLQPFYNDPDYLDVLTESIRSQLPEDNELLLFSFHGIPERHLRLSDPSHSHCLCVKDCCKRANPAHATCYRHQCIYTAKAVTERLGLAEGKSFISFQSRLGRDPWLSPATDATLERLAREGIKKVRVVCPAFVTDCLETLEEIAEEGKEIFMDAGGEDFALIPCLNESEAWIAYLEKRVLHWVEGQPA